MKIKNNDNCDANGRKERICTPVIAHCNPSPVFNSAKHVFDFVTLFIEVFIIRDRPLSRFPGRYAGRNTFFRQSRSEPVGIIPSISEQFPGVGQSVQKLCCPFAVTHLARRQEKENRPAFTIANGVKFGVQPAFCPSDTAGKSPFLSKLAAVRWALRWVASIISRSVSPCFSTSSINILLKTPSLLQRMNLLYKVLCGPCPS